MEQLLQMIPKAYHAHATEQALQNIVILSPLQIGGRFRDYPFVDGVSSNAR